MVENQSKDETELVTSSSELNSNDLQIVTPSDKNFVVIKSKFKVGVFCSKTTRLVTSLFKDESVLSIWLQTSKDGSETQTLCGLSLSGHILESKIIGRFDEPEKMTPLPPFVFIPTNVCYARAQTNEHGELDTIYFVTKDDDQEYSVMSKSVWKKKLLKYGKVTKSFGKYMFDFNQAFVLKSGSAVSGKPGTKLTFHCTGAGNRPWFHNIPTGRAVTAIACHPIDDRVAITGDSTGRIQIWRQRSDFQFFASEFHWHSLPVRSFAFSPESAYFYSGGGEGVILKWELLSGRRVAVVPRLGASVTAIAASHYAVIASLDTNVLKIFTPNLEDDQMITGLSKESQDSGVFWHPTTRCVVLKGPRRRVQFFDPLLKTQKFALDTSNQDDILGERDVDKKSLSELSLLSMSACGNWLATVESNWDTMNGNCLKIWKFSSQTGQINFELNTRINGAHDGEINSLSFINTEKTLGLVTCGKEGKAKLWELGEGQTWEPVRTFSHVGCVPNCVDSSKDRSVIAIAFDNKITLWSLSLLSLLSTLSTTADNNKDIYTSLAFGTGHILLGASTSSVHVWSLLTNQLTYKMSLEHPKLIKTPKSIQITCSSGIFNLDEKMKLKCLSRDSAHLSRLACSENHCFVVARTADKEDNNLLSLALYCDEAETKQNKGTDVSPVQSLSLMATSMARVKLNTKENIHTPKSGPILTAPMITNPVSKISLSVLKMSLPE